jgi:hypothetical protein
VETPGELLDENVFQDGRENEETQDGKKSKEDHDPQDYLLCSGAYLALENPH